MRWFYYAGMFMDVLAWMVFVPVILGVAAGVLYLYGYGIWWVAMYVIGLF